MLEFKVIQELKPNTEILEIIKSYTYITTYPITLTILEYKVNEISNKPFYIKEHNEKYNLKEIKQLLTKL